MSNTTKPHNNNNSNSRKRAKRGEKDAMKTHNNSRKRVKTWPTFKCTACGDELANAFGNQQCDMCRDVPTQDTVDHLREKLEEAQDELKEACAKLKEARYIDENEFYDYLHEHALDDDSDTDTDESNEYGLTSHHCGNCGEPVNDGVCVFPCRSGCFIPNGSMVYFCDYRCLALHGTPL
jgi:hypothetical protein